jgi:N-acetylglutamate synthase-like GNAT family acetyltransferase
MTKGAEAKRALPQGPAGEPAVTVARTDDLDAVRALGVASGLDGSERDDRGLVAAWAARAADGAMVGAIVLERSGGLDVVNWMAVAEAFRRRGVATRLLDALEREARAREVRRLWATARTPGFFAANGFRLVGAGPEADHLLGDCPSCRHYGQDCSPQAMVKDMDR